MYLSDVGEAIHFMMAIQLFDLFSQYFLSRIQTM